MTTNAVSRWGDSQQYEAAPMKAHQDEKTGVLPKVHLLWMTPDPLGAIAAACRMYEGKPTYKLSDITDQERLHYWEQAQATHLKAPLEFVKFHFFIEGVDRAFTHQMVRQRTAVYAQESMRFAVMGGNFLDNTSLPPSLHGTEKWDFDSHEVDDLMYEDEQTQWRARWDYAISQIENAYMNLVDSGMPAEEARGLLPHSMATRLNYSTDLRALMDHAGNRLCTQAQFHWRLVFAQIAQAIRDYGLNDDNCYTLGDGSCVGTGLCMHSPDLWQFQRVSQIFRPVCYELGHCPFQASFDRECSIRDRVQEFAKLGVPSSQWHDDSWMMAEHNHLNTIQPSEWMLNPSAARKT